MDHHSQSIIIFSILAFIKYLYSSSKKQKKDLEQKRADDAHILKIKNMIKHLKITITFYRIIKKMEVIIFQEALFTMIWKNMI